MAVYRVTARWEGFPGAPGYSNFHFGEFTGGADVDPMRERVQAFFGAMTTALAADVVIRIPTTVEVFDEDSGMLTGYLDGEEELSVFGSGSGGSFAGPVGAVVNWLTATVANGRRVRGRTFVVPLNATAYDSDGTLSGNALSRLREGADELVQDDFNSQFSVWSRPRDGSSGVLAPVTGYRVPDLAAVLRSRRD